MIRKYILPALAIIGVGVAVFMVLLGNRTPPVAQPVVQAARAPFASYIFGPGIVEASTENIAIGTPVSGIVTAVYVKWGDQVHTGDPIRCLKLIAVISKRSSSLRSPRSKRPKPTWQK
jgi:multidrug efflux pump subunit AcrA (membrane-fusion protein)